MAAEHLSDHPLHSISLDCISKPARDSYSYACLPRSTKDTKLEALPLPQPSLAKDALEINLPLKAHPHGKAAILAVAHTKTIANSVVHCKNTCLVSICAPNFRRMSEPGNITVIPPRAAPRVWDRSTRGIFSCIPAR